MTPMEVLLRGSDDERSTQALINGLRRKKDVATLSLLSGDPTVENFGRGLYGDVENKISSRISQREKKAQRELTGSYYNQMASQADAKMDLADRRLAETTRHNQAMEAKVLKAALDAKNRDVRNLSRDLTKAQIPELMEGIALIDKQLEPYIKKGGDLPGVGGAYNILPGITQDARFMKSVIARIRNTVLKARSGGAVTPQEATRLLEEFSLRGFNTDEDFLKSWADFKSVFQNKVSGVYSGYPPEVVDEYLKNMENQVSDGVDNPSGAPGAPGTGTDWESLSTSPGKQPDRSKTVSWSDL